MRKRNALPSEDVQQQTHFEAGFIEVADPTLSWTLTHAHVGFADIDMSGVQNLNLCFTRFSVRGSNQF